MYVKCTKNSSLVFVTPAIFLNIFYLQLVESADAECMDMKGWHYGCDDVTFSFFKLWNMIYIVSYT